MSTTRKLLAALAVTAALVAVVTTASAADATADRHFKQEVASRHEATAQEAQPAAPQGCACSMRR